MAAALCAACSTAPRPVATTPPTEPARPTRAEPGQVESAEATAQATRRGRARAASLRTLSVELAEQQAQARRRAASATPFVLLDAPDVRGPRDLVITAVGDVSQPTKQWRDRTMELKDRAFDPTKALLTSGDLIFMNLENPISERDPVAKKTYAFTSHPERLGWYFDVGFNLFSLSNNHIADADQPGIDDTLGHLERERAESGRPAWWAGASTDPDAAEAATTIEVPGKDLKIAFFSTGFSPSPNVSKFWSETLPARIREAHASHDVVIVSVHAGKEYQHVPAPELAQRYRDWIDAGADLVIGHHPHVIRPVEAYNGGLILHSLGNHVFASRTVRHRKYDARLYGMLARVVIQDGRVAAAEIVPTWANNSEDWVLPTGQRLPNSHFAPSPLHGPFADVFFEDFAAWTEAANATPIERVGDVGRLLVPDASLPVSFRLLDRPLVLSSVHREAP